MEEVYNGGIPAAVVAEPLRYPSAEFYSVSEAGETRVPASEGLPEIVPPAQLEFRFRLDFQGSGIPYKGERPTFHKPPTHTYPLDLDVHVWSADLRFATTDGLKPTAQQKIVLTPRGPSTTARFCVAVPPCDRQKGTVVIFVFLRHQGSLLAGFRIEASLTSGEDESGQTLEYIYL